MNTNFDVRDDESRIAKASAFFPKRVDPVVLALVAGVATLSVVDPPQLLPSAAFTLQSFASISPFLLIAVSLAAVATATGADGLIARAFQGRPAVAVVMAAAAGAFSPFCSCGVIPVIAALLRARVPLAPVMAFWIASPVMDPEMFVLTAAGIGPGFAAAKVTATLAMGLLAGFTIHLFGRTASFTHPLRESAGPKCSPGLSGGSIEWRFWRSPERCRRFARELRSSLIFLGKWLLLAFFVESLMTAYIPPGIVAGLLGAGAWYEVPLAAAIGIPAYLNGYAAIPLVSGLMEMGMHPGAAMAFMTAGAVSSIPAAMAVAVLVKRPVFAAYLALGLAGAILTGALYGLVAA